MTSDILHSSLAFCAVIRMHDVKYTDSFSTDVEDDRIFLAILDCFVTFYDFS